MRIEKIILENYRQYDKHTIQFDKNLNVIVGVMSTGKTNILNAINWCLYQEEPYLSRVSQALPLLNLKTIQETKGGPIKVMVRILVDMGDNRSITFTRTAYYEVAIKEKKRQPILYDRPVFEIRLVDKKGNTKILKDDEAVAIVERFVPLDLSEFFFFDGERLDTYFREATGMQIKHTIFKISQIDILHNIGENLDKITSDLKRDAGRQSPIVELARKDLEGKEKELDETKKAIEECEKQIKIAKSRLEELEEKLRHLPNIKEEEEKRKRIQEQIKDKKELYEDKKRDKNDLLFEYGKIIMLYPAIKKMIWTIQEKRKKKEIPPFFEPWALEKILKTKDCICGRQVGKGSKEEKKIERLLTEIKSASGIGKKLSPIESSLYLFENNIRKFKEKIGKITKEIRGYERDLNRDQQQINEINEKIGGYDSQKIKEWHAQRMSFEKIHSQNLENLGRLREKEKTDEKARNECNDKLVKEMSKEDKIKNLTKEINFIGKARKIVDDVESAIMNQVRKEISSDAEKKFFELHWKKESYESVAIGEDYDLHLMHSMGYPALGSLSGGEREVLALSFIIALHKVSGFDWPFVIDRPLAMVSGEPISNVAKVLSKVANKKQIILLLSPDDYKNIGKFWDNYRAYEVKLTKDEKVAIIKGI